MLLVVLVAAPVALAEHVTSSPSASARLAEEVSDTSWAVVVDWAVNCAGGGDNPSYFGNLNLVDTETNERIYMGGISSASGSTRQLVARRDKPRTMAPEIRAACGESGPPNHGSDFQTIRGAGVVVPARGSTGGGGTGGDTTNPDRRPGGPADPLASGGCAVERRGTAGADKLDGGAGHDLLYGLGGADLIRGLAGNDCLVGGDGSDRLFGAGGADRLTAGAGADHLHGGTGADVLDAGSGNDVLRARDGRRETVRCGSGRDRAVVDRRDRVSGCERVERG